MWVEALDLVLQRLVKSGLDFGKVAALSGSGQQQGSVYWKKGGSGVLSSLDSKKPSVDQLGDAFSIKESPIWMDSSTTAQSREIGKADGSALELSQITGSRAYERFTGPQIRNIHQKQPEVYDNTERISLVSSFMASLFIGAYAGIDHTDGAGMNLMDINRRVWSKKALEATAPGLEEKLGKLAPAHAIAGNISSYFVERYSFNKNCLVVQWSGDNPNSLAGLTLSIPGDLAISLGTSDTVFGIASDPKPGLEGHVFPNPVDTEGYMVMLCYKNGSLTREDSASLGGALRAAHGWVCSQKGSFVPIADLYKGKLEKSALSCKLSVNAGNQGLVSKYALLMKKRIEIENRLVKDLGRC